MVANAWKEVSTYLPSIAENVTEDIIFLVLHLYIHNIYCLRIQNNLQNSK